MDIYYIHTTEIDKNQKYQSLVNDIIGDMLMYKVYSNDRGDICLRHLNHDVLTLIREWYLFANYLSQFKRRDICVYRGVKHMNPIQNHYQPIPFSTSYNFANALEWIIPNTYHSFIMCLYVSHKTIYTFTGNLEEGNEVILPAGSLFFLKQVKLRNTFLVYFRFSQSDDGIESSLQKCNSAELMRNRHNGEEKE